MRRSLARALTLLLLVKGASGCDWDSGPPTQPGGRELGEVVQTEAEYITHSCTSEVQACLLTCPADDLMVAINPDDYAGSEACGACMEVTGPLGTVTVKVTQNCASACAPGEIELSEEAFSRIADVSEGHAPVSWRLVSCTVTGNLAFHYEPESTEWWVSVQVRNHAVPIATLELQQSDGTWLALPRQMSNTFEAADHPGPGPFTFRITSIDDQVIVEPDVPLRPGELVQGTQQFE